MVQLVCNGTGVNYVLVLVPYLLLHAVYYVSYMGCTPKKYDKPLVSDQVHKTKQRFHSHWMFLIFCDRKSSSSQHCSIQPPEKGRAICYTHQNNHQQSAMWDRLLQRESRLSPETILADSRKRPVPGKKLLYGHSLLTNLNRVLIKERGAYGCWGNVSRRSAKKRLIEVSDTLHNIWW